MGTAGVICGEVVAFVVAEDEEDPGKGVEFQNAVAALESPSGGAFFVKIELPSREFSYGAGINPKMSIGMCMYRVQCADCREPAWLETRPQGSFFCEACTA